MEETEDIFKECERFELITGQKSLKNIYIYEKMKYKQFKIEKLTESLNLIYLEKINRNVKL